MLNPFLISNQREGEDQLTYALACTLESGGPPLLRALLAALGVTLDDGGGALMVEVQTSSASSRPDAWFRLHDCVALIFESKIKEGKLDRVQLEGHLSLAGASPEPRKILLVVAPERKPPDLIDEMRKDYPHAEIVYASWQTVHDWVVYTVSKQEDDPAGTLMDSLAGFIRSLGLASTLKTDFVPETVSLLEKQAVAFCGMMDQQHAAQERFLGEVAAALRSRLQERLPSGTPIPQMAVYSRRDQRWTVVSSVIDFSWTLHPLEGWASQHLWCEIYLRSWSSPNELRIRSGVLVDGRHLVARWLGKVQKQGAARFGDTFRPYTRRSVYGEAWSDLPFTPFADRGALMGHVVGDLEAWLFEVLPALVASVTKQEG